MALGRKPAGSLAYLVDEIAPAVVEAGLDRPDVEALALRRHVARTADQLGGIERFAEAIDDGRVAVVGGVYDVDTGPIDLLP